MSTAMSDATVTSNTSLFDGLLCIPVLVTSLLLSLLSDNDVIRLLQTKRAVRDVVQKRPYLLKHSLSYSTIRTLTMNQTSALIRIGRIHIDRSLYEPPRVVNFVEVFAHINVTSLYHLRLHMSYSQPLSAADFPPSITSLAIGNGFREKLTPQSFSSSLTELTFDNIMCALDSYALPESLTTLSVMRWPKEIPIQPGTLPSSLRSFTCHSGIYADIALYSLPTSLTELIGLTNFTPNNNNILLSNNLLQILKFNDVFNDNIMIGCLPHSITDLDLGVAYNHKLLPGVLPQSLLYLTISSYYNHKLEIGVLPPLLKSLIFQSKRGFSTYNHPIDLGVLPNKLEILTLSTDFNQALTPGVFPSSVTSLRFGLKFNQPILLGVLPSNLTSLHFEKAFQQRITTQILPRKLTHVYMYNCYLPRSIIWQLIE